MDNYSQLFHRYVTCIQKIFFFIERRFFFFASKQDFLFNSFCILSLEGNESLAKKCSRQIFLKMICLIVKQKTKKQIFTKSLKLSKLVKIDGAIPTYVIHVIVPYQVQLYHFSQYFRINCFLTYTVTRNKCTRKKQ